MYSILRFFRQFSQAHEIPKPPYVAFQASPCGVTLVAGGVAERSRPVGVLTFGLYDNLRDTLVWRCSRLTAGH